MENPEPKRTILDLKSMRDPLTHGLHMKDLILRQEVILRGPTGYPSVKLPTGATLKLTGRLEGAGYVLSVNGIEIYVIDLLYGFPQGSLEVEV